MSEEQSVDDIEYNRELSRAEIASVHPFKDHVVRQHEANVRASDCVLSRFGVACPCQFGKRCRT
jgi:hypothetical protein